MPLLTKLPDTVTLHEPVPPRRVAGPEGEEAVLGAVGRRTRQRERDGLRGLVEQQPVRPVSDGQAQT